MYYFKAQPYQLTSHCQYFGKTFFSKNLFTFRSQAAKFYKSTQERCKTSGIVGRLLHSILVNLNLELNLPEAQSLQGAAKMYSCTYRQVQKCLVLHLRDESKLRFYAPLIKNSAHQCFLRDSKYFVHI